MRQYFAPFPLCTPTTNLRNKRRDGAMGGDRSWLALKFLVGAIQQILQGIVVHSVLVMRDAERRGMRSHAERGNEGLLQLAAEDYF